MDAETYGEAPSIQADFACVSEIDAEGGSVQGQLDQRRKTKKKKMKKKNTMGSQANEQ